MAVCCQHRPLRHRTLILLLKKPESMMGQKPNALSQSGLSMTAKLHSGLGTGELRLDSHLRTCFSSPDFPPAHDHSRSINVGITHHLQSTARLGWCGGEERGGGKEGGRHLCNGEVDRYNGKVR